MKRPTVREINVHLARLETRVYVVLANGEFPIRRAKTVHGILYGLSLRRNEWIEIPSEAKIELV